MFWLQISPVSRTTHTPVTVSNLIPCTASGGSSNRIMLWLASRDTVYQRGNEYHKTGSIENIIYNTVLHLSDCQQCDKRYSFSTELIF